VPRCGVLFAIDEVITGFRLAYGGAQERFGVVPDLATYGKVLGGGLPVGAITGRADLMEVFTGLGAERGIFSGGTFSGNPLTMEAGAAAVSHLRDHPEIYSRLDAAGDRLAAAVNGFCEARQIPAQMKHVGSMFHMFFQREPIDSMRDVNARTTAGRESVLPARAEPRRARPRARQRRVPVRGVHGDAEIDYADRRCSGARRSIGSRVSGHQHRARSAKRCASFLDEHLTPDMREAARPHDHGVRRQGPGHALAADPGASAAGRCPRGRRSTAASTGRRHRSTSSAKSAPTHAPGLIPLGLRMLAPVLFRYGTREQKRYYLPRILSGEHYWCQGYSEPGSGSDLSSLKTTAVKDGDDYVVNGTKIWTTHAHFADHIFCLVRTIHRQAPGRNHFLLIPMSTPGITVEPIITLAGDHEVNQVFFDDVRVPQATGWGRRTRAGRWPSTCSSSNAAAAARHRASRWRSTS
jgi:hypothetical protein